MTMGKNDFSSLLTAQLKKATETAAPKSETKPAKADAPEPVVKAPVEQVEEQAPAPAKAAEKEKPAASARPKASKAATGKGTQGRNTNRITVNLFEADSRALAVIRELLGSAGHDFTSRSDSMKIGLRLAAKAKPEDLAKILDQVKSEDRRFSSEKE
jgi:hypothetical protein